MGRVFIFVTLCGLLLYRLATALRCLQCNGVSTESQCRAEGTVTECKRNEDACEIELRKHEGWGGGIKMYKRCKQSRACDNNYVQNPRSAWMPSQCNPEDFNSVCRCCCFTNECNVANDKCFGQRGCGLLPTSIQGGSISCTDGRNDGSVCTTTCNANSLMVGTASTMCLGNTWSHPVPSCGDVHCPPRVLENGWHICSHGYQSGSTCSAHCMYGYSRVGPYISVCRKDGKWSNSFGTTCRGRRCPGRGRVVGGTVILSDGQNMQSRSSVVCDIGRRLKGIKDSYCQDNGKWSHRLPTCESYKCPARGTIANGLVRCSDGSEIRSQCRAQCNEGYRLEGASSSECLTTGHWDEPLPKCVEISCRPRGKFKGGVVACSNGNSIGSICRAYCLGAAQLIGVSVSECLATGQWSDPLPSCRDIRCPNIGRVANGQVSCTRGTFPGSVCTVKCNVDYLLVGMRRSVCESTGNWSEPLPECRRTVCPPLDFSRQAGTMTCTDENYYKSVCSFTCARGYRRVGAPRLICSSDERWNTRMPTCTEIRCPPRGTIENGDVACTDENNVGSRCKATCDEDFDLSGDADSVCLPNGRWSKPLPHCAETDCPNQGDLRHGKMTCTSGSALGSECKFVCETAGYSLYPEGRTKNVCNQTKLWSERKPCCARQCPPHALMDFVIVLDGSKSIGQDNWNILHDWVSTIIGLFDVAKDAAHIAVLKYTHTQDKRTQIRFNDHPGDVKGLVEDFKKITYNGGGTKTGAALEHALDDLLSEEHGNRPDVPDLVLVITDGVSNDSVTVPAKNLRDSGATILVVGIVPEPGDSGYRLDEEQLKIIAGNERNVKVARNGFADLTAEYAQIIGKQICTDPCA